MRHLRRSLLPVAVVTAACAYLPQADAALLGPVLGTASRTASTSDGGATWALQPGPLLAYRNSDNQTEWRSAIEFDTLAITGPVQVSSASLRFTVTAIVYEDRNPTAVRFYGYSDANGNITTSDVTKIATPLGASVTFGPNDNQLGTYEVALDTAFIESLINTGGRLGIVMQATTADSNATSIQILSTNNNVATFGDRMPALTVGYTVVPEPASLALLGLGTLWFLRRRGG